MAVAVTTEIFSKGKTKGHMYPSNLMVIISMVKNNILYKCELSMPDFSTILIEDKARNISRESEKITVSNIELDGLSLYHGKLTGYIKAMIQNAVLKFVTEFRNKTDIDFDVIRFLDTMEYTTIAALLSYIICKNRGYCDINNIDGFEENSKIVELYKTITSGKVVVNTSSILEV